jgi:hypothetical protein
MKWIFPESNDASGIKNESFVRLRTFSHRGNSVGVLIRSVDVGAILEQKQNVSFRCSKTRVVQWCKTVLICCVRICSALQHEMHHEEKQVGARMRDEI